MGINIFPGVYTTIKDESFFVQPSFGSMAFMCILSEKGPDNTVRLTTSLSDLIDTYGVGDIKKYGQGWYVASQYLSILSNLYIVRCTPDDAKFSMLAYKLGTVSAGDPAEETSVITEVDALENMSLVTQFDTIFDGDTADIIFYPVGRGSWYNNVAIKLTPSFAYGKDRKDIYIIDIYETVENSTIPALSESFVVSFNRKAKDMNGESMFICDILERYSDLVRCAMSDKITTSTANITDFAHPFTSWMFLKGGSDGSIIGADGCVNWGISGEEPETNGAVSTLIDGYLGLCVNPMTGQPNDEILDVDCIQFATVFDAGYPTPVKDAMVALSDSRNDCIVLADNGDNSRPSTALQTRETTHRYDNYKVSLFEMYSKVWDNYTGKYMWITPIYHVAKAFAKTTRDYSVVYPFAGPVRGVCDGIVDIRYKLVGENKNKFKLARLNPIMRWSQGSDNIWGNWTTQYKPSSLQDISVVRTLLQIKSDLERNLKFFIYELNDAYTWEIMKESISKYLGELKAQRILEYFQIRVDASDYDKKLHKVNVVVDLKITSAIEIISVTLAVH